MTQDLSTTSPNTVKYETTLVEGLNVAYREAGNQQNPKLVLLHGFPASSHQYRNLIPALADTFHLVAPDYPGFGHSAMPPVDAFDYTFDNLAKIIDAFSQTLGLRTYTLYVMDYG